MKKTITLIALSFISFSCFSQTAKDTTKPLHLPMRISKPAVGDSTPTYYFKIADLNAMLPVIQKEIFKKGWDNVSTTDIFNFFVSYLEQKKQYK